MGYLRKKWVTTNVRRIVETGLFGAATISAMALIVINFRTCDVIPACEGVGPECTHAEEEDYKDQTKFFIGWDCKDN